MMNNFDSEYPFGDHWKIPSLMNLASIFNGVSIRKNQLILWLRENPNACSHIYLWMGDKESSNHL